MTWYSMEYERSIKNNNKIIIYGNGRRILNLVHVNKLILIYSKFKILWQI